jgi:FeS assembly SUF system regulator
MIRMSRLTDYGIVLMSHVAAHPEHVHTAAEVAAEAQLPLPTVSKLLRVLTRRGLLVSQRGVKGGYTLSRPARAISLAAIISALEGPIALTLCTVGTRPDCEYQPRCPVSGRWQRINWAIRQALEDIPLSDMANPLAPSLAAVQLAARSINPSALSEREPQ